MFKLFTIAFCHHLTVISYLLKSSDWVSLKEHYEGIGIHTFGIFEAEQILTDLFHSGKKIPTHHVLGEV